MTKKGRQRRQQLAQADAIRDERQQLSPIEELNLLQLIEEVKYGDPDLGDKLIPQAINTVNRARANRENFLAAGVPEKYIDKEIGLRKGFYKDVEGMPAGIPMPMLQPEGLQGRNIVPAPWVDKNSKPGVERRIHTKYQWIPELNRVEVVPVRDVMTNKPLVTEVGDSTKYPQMDLEGFNLGSEYIQDRAMKLMGARNVELANKEDPAGIDFNASFPAGRGMLPEVMSGIDGEIRWSSDKLRRKPNINTLPVQITTMSRTPDWKGKDGYQIRDAVEKEMETQLKLGPRVNLLDAYRNAQGLGRIITDDQNYDYGKLMKDDYDYLIMPGFDRKRADGNKEADKRKSGPTTILPETLHMVDLERATDYIRGITGRNASEMMYVRTAPSGFRGGGPRARVYAEIPQDATTSSGLPVAENMLTSRNQGLVAQLVNDLGPIENKETIQDLRRMAGQMMADDIITSLQ